MSNMPLLVRILERPPHMAHLDGAMCFRSARWRGAVRPEGHMQVRLFDRCFLWFPPGCLPDRGKTCHVSLPRGRGWGIWGQAHNRTHRGLSVVRRHAEGVRSPSTPPAQNSLPLQQTPQHITCAPIRSALHAARGRLLNSPSPTLSLSAPPVFGLMSTRYVVNSFGVDTASKTAFHDLARPCSPPRCQSRWKRLEEG